MRVPPPAGTSLTVADPHAGHFFPVLVGKRSRVLTSPSAVTLPVIANAAKSLMVAPLGDKLGANADRPAGQVQVDLGPVAITRLGAGAHRGQWPESAKGPPQDGDSSHSGEGRALCRYRPVMGDRALCVLAAPRAATYAVEIVVRNFVGR